jgi:hypothetical protein
LQFFIFSGMYGRATDLISSFYTHFVFTLSPTRIKSIRRPIEAGLCSRTTRFDDVDGCNRDWMPEMHPQYFNGHRSLVPIILQRSPSWLVLLMGTNDVQSSILAQYDAERAGTKQKGYPGEWWPEPEDNAVEESENLETKSFERGKKNYAYKDESTHSSHLCPQVESIVGVGPGAAADATAVAESCAMLALDAQRFFPDLRVVLVTPPPVCLTTESRAWGFDGRGAAASRAFSAAFRQAAARYGFFHADPAYGNGPGAIIDMRESRDGVHMTEAHGAIVADAVWRVMRPALLAEARGGAALARCALPRKRRRSRAPRRFSPGGSPNVLDEATTRAFRAKRKRVPSWALEACPT